MEKNEDLIGKVYDAGDGSLHQIIAESENSSEIVATQNLDTGEINVANVDVARVLVHQHEDK